MSSKGETKQNLGESEIVSRVVQTKNSLNRVRVCFMGENQMQGQEARIMVRRKARASLKVPTKTEGEEFY